MSLDIACVKRPDMSEKDWDIFPAECVISYGYMSHLNFRKELLQATYPEYKVAFCGLYPPGTSVLPDEWVDEFFKKDEGLATFIMHCNCDGHFTPDECEKVYDSLCTVNPDSLKNVWNVNYLKRWKSAFKYCAENSLYLLFI